MNLQNNQMVYRVGFVLLFGLFFTTSFGFSNSIEFQVVTDLSISEEEELFRGLENVGYVQDSSEVNKPAAQNISGNVFKTYE